MRRLLAGVAAGLAGTAAVSVLGAVETRIRGRAAVFDPAVMAGRLAAHAGLDLGDRERRWAGRIMRWPYGAGWGGLLGVAAPALPWPVAGIALGGAVLGFELAALPLAGATPGVRRWGRDEIASDAVNTLAYGLVAAGTLRLLRAAGRTGRRRPRSPETDQ